MDETDKLIAAAKRATRGFVATVVRTEGSTYRRAGARCVISDQGEVTGTISGGCLERDLVARAGDWADMLPRTITYDATRDDDIVFGLGLGCRGVIEIRIEPFDAGHPVEIVRQSPQTVLAIYGGGADVEPLAQLAEMIGWDVRVTRPRDVHPEQVTAPEADAIVVMTHNYLYDQALLPKMLSSKARYIGLLGPKSRGAELLVNLPADSRVHTPAGLNLGSETPEEIALSIVAEIQAVLSERDAQPLREIEVPLHARASDSVCGPASAGRPAKAGPHTESSEPNMPRAKS